VRVPLLANITEFGKTPLFTRDELHAAGVRLVLYPLSAFRAAARASLDVYAAIRSAGTQQSMLERMQTRTELYDVLRYHDYERKLDELFGGSLLKDKHQQTAPPAPAPKKSVMLSGVPAGNTALCSVGRTGNDLNYRGYDILEIATTCEFEEIAYLLIHGKLPNRAELRGYKRSSQSLRGLPATVRAVLEVLPAASHPMDVLRTGVSALGCTLPESESHPAAGARDIADRLIASVGSMLTYWYHYSHSGSRITSKPRTTRSAATSCTCCIGARRALHGCAQCTRRSFSTRSMSSTPRRSRPASSPERARICTPASSARSAHSQAPSTAAPMRRPRRSRAAMTVRTTPRPTSARGSPARRSSSDSDIRCIRSPTRAMR
jgi:hypothetical protein